MKTVTTFNYHEVENILLDYVKDRTLDFALKEKEITASAPYGEYKVTISEKPEPEEKEVSTDE